MTLLYVCLFVGHFVGDFLLQSRKMGKDKSTNFTVLLDHLLRLHGTIFTFSVIPLVFIARQKFPEEGAMSQLYIAVVSALYLSYLNTMIHGIIDWNIWRVYKWYTKRRIDSYVEATVVAVSDKFEESWKELPRNKENFIRVHTERRINEWRYWEDYWFYTTIGFDQLLHALTLVVLANSL